MKTWARAVVLLALTSTVGLFFGLGLNDMMTFSQIKTNQAEMRALFDMAPVWTMCAYFVLYIATTALSLPGATILTLAGGALFGLGRGLILISFASTIGATLALLTARFLFREAVERRFHSQMEAINRGFKREGVFYLFTLRLVPLFPFFMINLLMGLTKMPVLQFFWISQLGMLPGTLAYVNAGTRLAELESPYGIIAPKFWLSFAILGILPLASKKLVEYLRRRT